MTVWVTGSTHIVLLPMNVIFGKECEEIIAPPIESVLSCLTGTFLNNYDVVVVVVVFISLSTLRSSFYNGYSIAIICMFNMEKLLKKLIILVESRQIL